MERGAERPALGPAGAGGGDHAGHGKRCCDGAGQPLLLRPFLLQEQSEEGAALEASTLYPGGASRSSGALGGSPRPQRHYAAVPGKGGHVRRLRGGRDKHFVLKAQTDSVQRREGIEGKRVCSRELWDLG